MGEPQPAPTSAPTVAPAAAPASPISTASPETTGRKDGRAAALRRRRLVAFGRGMIIAIALGPLARLGSELAQGRLGANPIAEAMNRLGWWSLVWLLLSLAMTPLQILTGASWPIALRKTLGLIAFGYVLLHFSVYLGVDQFFDFGEIGRDIVKRKFITVGFLGFVLLIPLAITSTSGWVKRLGARRWKRLHRLVYASALLGIVHFVWRVKSDLREPTIFAIAYAALMGIRLLRRRGSPSARTFAMRPRSR
jgi:sulfoxide reductase heme-binding subunit YedZ